MYNIQPIEWYYPYESNPQEMVLRKTMMSGDMKQMMDMMREHMRMTDEIRRVVHEINDRCKRMEKKMGGRYF